MSEPGLQIEPEVITRKSRAEEGLTTLDEIDARSKGPTPEEALAAAQSQIAAKDQERDAALARAAQAEREAAEAKRVVAETSTARVSDQEVAIANAIEAGNAAKQAAAQKIKSAREMGDFDAELAAQDELNAASYRLMRAKETKGQFDAWKAKQPKAGDAQQRQEQQGAPAQTPEVQSWLAAHPMYTKDQEYTADANASHNLALEAGCAEGSKAYVDYIDARLSRLYGPDHGKPGVVRGASNGGNQVDKRATGGRTAASTAAPVSRGGSNVGGGGGGVVFNHETGSLRLTTITDPKSGQPKETVQGNIPADWVEAAKWNKMDPITYAVEQMHIQREIKDGSLSGLTHGESGTYR